MVVGEETPEPQKTVRCLHSIRWTQVAMVMGTRHADREFKPSRKLRTIEFAPWCHVLISLIECAKRWQHSLDPSLDRSEWKPDEYARLQQAVAKYGRSWKVIAEKEFPGRSNTDLKNRLALSEERALRNMSVSMLM